MASILVTGGTGLIGSNLCTLLTSKGHNVSILSRRKTNKTNVFNWDIEKKHIDKEAIINTDYIIHLAGAGIADKRWSAKRKKELLESRVLPAQLLKDDAQLDGD